MPDNNAGLVGAGSGSVQLAPGGTPRSCTFSGGHQYGKFARQRESLPILAPENYGLQSETFDVAPWTVSNSSIIANAAAGPFGDVSADTLHEDATAATGHSVRHLGLTLVSGVEYEFSISVKAINRNWIAVRTFHAPGNPIAYFDASTGNFGIVSAGFTSYSATSQGSGWWRIKLVFTSDTVVEAFWIYAASADGVNAFNGLDQDSLYLWGAQFRRVLYSTNEYIKTTATAITSGTDGSLFEFSRASVGTYVNADGIVVDAAVDQLRNEPLYGRLCGNRYGYSENFVVGFSTIRATWPADQTESDPLGGTRASIIHEDATPAASHFFFSAGDSFRSLQGQTHVLSLYVKPINRYNLEIQFNDATAGNKDFRVKYDLSSMTATAAFGAPNGFGIIDAGNGWYRVWMSFTRTDSADGTNQQILFLLLDSAGNSSFDGLDQDSMYMFGVQLDSDCASSAGPGEYDSNNSGAHTNLYLRGGENGWLFESEKTNICLRSQEINVAPWGVHNSSITANSEYSPALTQTADVLVDDNTLNLHSVGQDITLLANSRYTFSCFVRPDGTSNFSFIVALNGGMSKADFDLAAVQCGLSGTKGDFRCGIQPVCNGWFRCWLSYDTDATDGGVRNIGIYAADAGGIIVYTGTTANTIHLWGAQMELGHMTSYIRTVAASAKRNFDYGVIDKHVMNRFSCQLFARVQYMFPNVGSNGAVVMYNLGNPTANANGIRFGAGFGVEQISCLDYLATAQDHNFITQAVPGAEDQPIYDHLLVFKNGSFLAQTKSLYDSNEWSAPVIINGLGVNQFDNQPGDLVVSGYSVIPGPFRVMALEAYSV